jgi:hypothetical protein
VNCAKYAILVYLRRGLANAKPRPAKLSNIIAQVEGSGTLGIAIVTRPLPWGMLGSAVNVKMNSPVSE